MTANPLEIPLREIHLPASISWWPPAPGWWIVLFSLVIFIILFFVLRKVFRQPLAKKQAGQALDRIEQRLKDEAPAVDCLADLSVLLRRLMLLQKPAINCAGLTGLAWLKMLDGPLNEPEFSQGVGRILISGPYQREAEKEEVIQVILLCRKWVKLL